MIVITLQNYRIIWCKTGRDQWHSYKHSNETLACVHCEELFEHLLVCEERNSTELVVMLVDMAVHSQGIFESILDASVYCRCQSIILPDQYN